MFQCSDCCVRPETEEVQVESLKPPFNDADTPPVNKPQEVQSPREREGTQESAGSSQPFQVEVEKTAANEFGIDVDWGDGRTLRVTKVKDTGMVAKWNSEHAEVFCVRQGDIITEVNGATGNSLDLLKAFLQVSKHNGKLNLTVLKATSEVAS
mmetsp:Transcript_628/g.1059  ORF Transcript_628/g.1059 Transcript_628/m.1059 type:complete len:153 (+) Transcript_628:69-527(+)